MCGLSASHVAISSSACVDCQKRSCGYTEPLLWIGLRRAEGSTSCRRLVIDLPSLRRCDGEGSPWQRWGLVNSVKSKERFGIIEGKNQYNRKNDSAKKRERFIEARQVLKNVGSLPKTDLAFDKCQHERDEKHKNCIFLNFFHRNILLVRKKAVPLHSLSKTKGVKLTNWVDFEEQKSSSLTDWNKVRNKTRQRGGWSTSDKVRFVKTSATSIPLYVY